MGKVSSHGISNELNRPDALLAESPPFSRGALGSIWLILLTCGSAVRVATVLMFVIASSRSLLSAPVSLARGTSLGSGSCLIPLCRCVHSSLTPRIRIRLTTRIALRTSCAFASDCCYSPALTDISCRPVGFFKFSMVLS